jgi:prolyl oligopeptidase PreP (S9A serine peptidase family)
MISEFFKTKKRKAEEERIEKLEKARDLWLNYQIHYILYNIHHKDPVTKEVKIFRFPKEISRKTQQDAYKKDKTTWQTIVIKEGHSLLSKNVGYWIGGKAARGTVIQEPLDVDFKEITKAEFIETETKG